MENDETSIFTFYHEICLHCLTHFFINLKLLLNYREIDIRSAEANTIKELITTLPAFQKFMIFLFSPLRSSSYFYLLAQP